MRDWHFDGDISKFVDCGNMMKCYNDSMENPHVPFSDVVELDWFNRETEQMVSEGVDDHGQGMGHFHFETGSVRHFHSKGNIYVLRFKFLGLPFM